MRYMQLKAEGRDEEAQQLAEAPSFKNQQCMVLDLALKAIPLLDN